MLSGRSIHSVRLYRIVISFNKSATVSSIPGLSIHSLAKPLNFGVQTWFLKAKKRAPNLWPSSTMYAGCQISRIVLLLGVPDIAILLSNKSDNLAIFLLRFAVRFLNAVNSSITKVLKLVRSFLFLIRKLTASKLVITKSAVLVSNTFCLFLA